MKEFARRPTQTLSWKRHDPGRRRLLHDEVTVKVISTDNKPGGMGEAGVPHRRRHRQRDRAAHRQAGARAADVAGECAGGVEGLMGDCQQWRRDMLDFQRKVVRVPISDVPFSD